MVGGGRYIEWAIEGDGNAQRDPATLVGDVRVSDDAGASVMERGAVLETFLCGLVEVVRRLEKSGKAVVDLAGDRGPFIALRDGDGFEMDYERTTLRYASVERFTAALADAVDGYLAAIGESSTPAIEELRAFAVRHVSS